ncbi:hypothetical protein CBM2599_A10420 [Cupriavidus taiwanensis]|uniref:Uncharacterized protein n=1 Tax=Cupriavidus taiwanensis TaxID=164546 RepID=A0A375CTU5_9BURK|nr:hypothetical protein CBM2599_A10420 [Cupriavidus taiwanensis]SOY80608.1 hypothetical protein CBM2600_A10265 [Cupriavidus taiwanensis]SPD63124.1 conserved protein of unknown function [Cupriavidus taiwanensis]
METNRMIDVYVSVNQIGWQPVLARPLAHHGDVPAERESPRPAARLRPRDSS